MYEIFPKPRRFHIVEVVTVVCPACATEQDAEKSAEPVSLTCPNCAQHWTMAVRAARLPTSKGDKP